MTGAKTRTPVPVLVKEPDPLATPVKVNVPVVMLNVLLPVKVIALAEEKEAVEINAPPLRVNPPALFPKFASELTLKELEVPTCVPPE